MKKRLLAILLAICLIVGMLPVAAVAAEAQASVTLETGTAPLSEHVKGTDQYDIVYYAGRPYYVMDEDYMANEEESGILMLSQYVYNYGTQWAYSRPQVAVDNDSTSIMTSDYALSTFLNGGQYSDTISNLATKFGDDWDFKKRDIQYNSYYKRNTATAAVSGVTAYFEKIVDKYTQVTLSVDDWKENVWYEMQDGQYVLASGSYDATKTYYRDDAKYQLVETPDWANGPYYYFKLETTAESKLKDLGNKQIGALYYAVPSITNMTTSSKNGYVIVAGTEATDAANSFIAQQKFTDVELGAALAVTKNSDQKYSATTWNPDKDGQTILFKDIPVNGESFFALSAEEVNDYFADGEEASAFAYYGANNKNTVAKWWLRSYKPNTTATVGYFNSYNASKASTRYKNFISTTYPELKSVGVRPAFVLDPEKVLLVSDCSTNTTGKYYYETNSVFDSSEWRPLYDESTTEWKLTLIDDENLSIKFDTDNITIDAENNTISVPYTGATSTHSGQHYISAFIPGVGYTRVEKPGTLSNAKSGKNGTATIKLPESVDAENCQVQIFLERPNGQKVTDYATTPVTITTETSESEIETEQTKSLKVLFIGNSLSEDARTFLPQVAEQYPYLEDAEIEFASLYQGGRSLGYFANCARVEQGDTDYDYSYYMNTNATTNSKPNLFTAEQIEKFNLTNNGYNDATKNFCEYWVWDNESGKWVQKKNADNLGEKTIANAMNEQDWDIVLVQGYACDFFGDNYDSTHSTGYRSATSEKNLKDNLQYLTNYLRELQPGVKIGFYLPTVHLENVWKTDSVEMYADMMARKADIESWNLVDFTISGATAMENAKTTYLGTVTCDNSKDKVVAGLRRDTLHASKYVGRELLAMNIVEAAVRYLYGTEGLGGFNPIETINSPAAGKLPTEYANILHAAVEATIANPNQITTLTGFSAEDPAVMAYNAAKAAQEEGKSVDECIAAGKAALTEQQMADLKVNSDEKGVSFTYGYTTSEALTWITVDVNTDNVQNVTITGLSDNNQISTWAGHNVELTFSVTEGFEMPETFTVQIGETSYTVTTSDGTINPTVDGLTYSDCKLIIAADLLSSVTEISITATATSVTAQMASDPDTPVSGDGTDTPDASEDSTETPDVSEDSTETPDESEDTVETPDASENATETPDVSEDSTETPDESEDIVENPDAS